MTFLIFSMVLNASLMRKTQLHNFGTHHELVTKTDGHFMKGNIHLLNAQLMAVSTLQHIFSHLMNYIGFNMHNYIHVFCPLYQEPISNNAIPVTSSCALQYISVFLNAIVTLGILVTKQILAWYQVCLKIVGTAMEHQIQQSNIYHIADIIPHLLQGSMIIFGASFATNILNFRLIIRHKVGLIEPLLPLSAQTELLTKIA